MSKFNKGEWSELFVFLSILFKGKIHAADENLNKIDEVFYIVLKAIRDNVEYVLEKPEHLKLINVDKSELMISTLDFENEIQTLFDKIKNTNG